MRRLGGSGDMNLPYEPSSGHLTDNEGDIASGVVVMAAVVNVPEAGPMPALVFRFARPDGSGFYPVTCLVCEGEDLAALPSLVTAAVAGAIKAAAA
jgi:hypothetical protein